MRRENGAGEREGKGTASSRAARLARASRPAGVAEKLRQRSKSGWKRRERWVEFRFWGGAQAGRRTESGCGIVPDMDERREFLRHTLATLAYRATRALENAPESFAEFDGTGKTPVEILAHMGDLFDWSLSICQGRQTWHRSAPLTWAEEQKRFFAALEAFDASLVSGEADAAPLDKLFQGPVADALTHVGQLAMLRRLAGCPTRGENFFVAEVAAGRVTAEQAEAVKTY